MRKWLAPGMLSAAAVVVVAVVVLRNGSGNGGTKYLTAVVRRQTVAQTIAATGSIQPAQVFSLTFGGGATTGNASGGGGNQPVTEVDVAVGQLVAAGQALAKVSSTSQDAQLNVAQRQLVAAQQKATVPIQITGQQDYNAQVAANDVAIAQAEQAVSSAQASVDATVLKAPVAGQIQAVNIAAGVVPPSGAAIQERSGGFSVEADVSERDVTQVIKGQKADVTLPALGTTLSATVVGLPSSANAAPGNVASAATTAVTFPVQLALDPTDANVLPGMSAQISIALASHDNVLAVPTSAIQGTTGAPTVRVMRNGKPVSVPVEIGLSTDSLTEIVVGVKEGDVVVTGVVNPTQTPTVGGGGVGGGGGGITGRGGGFGGGAGRGGGG